jgi:hypothetical protein
MSGADGASQRSKHTKSERDARHGGGWRVVPVTWASVGEVLEVKWPDAGAGPAKSPRPVKLQCQAMFECDLIRKSLRFSAYRSSGGRQHYCDAVVESCAAWHAIMQCKIEFEIACPTVCCGVPIAATHLAGQADRASHGVWRTCARV